MSTPSPSPDTGARARGGLIAALTVYGIWGALPVYFLLFSAVPALELVAYRTLFSMPLCLIMIAVSGQLGEVRLALTDRRRLFPLLASAALIGTNWLFYISAVTQGHVLAASLGYYINPLVNVLIGTIFLRERMSRAQWGAVGLAGIGVAVLAWGARDMLWISLSLAMTFALYGLVRKLVPAPALAGLTVETMVLAPLAALYLAWLVGNGGSIVLGSGWRMDLLLASTGIMTAVPLMLFAVAARRLDLSTLGFIQYLTPSLLLLESVFLFKEPLRPVQLGSFALIWLAIAIYSAELVVRQRRESRV